MQEVRRSYFVGLDLGQSRDPSALSVVEHREVFDLLARSPVPGEPPFSRFHSRLYIVREMRRFPLRTSYVDVARGIEQVMGSPSLRPPVMVLDGDGEIPVAYRREIAGPFLVVDATGIGKPVSDYLTSLNLNPVSIVLTSGDTIHPASSGVGVPKRDVVTTLQMLFETKQLKLAGNMELLPAFLKELRTFRLSISPTGRDTYAGATGSHDDLVLSTALALWYAEALARQPKPQAYVRPFDIYHR